MLRNLAIVAAAALVIALPFLFRRRGEVSRAGPADLSLVVISPHNEAIRHEFGRGFAAWHRERFGQSVRVDWRNVGGTTEIMRYLVAEYTSSFRAWRRARGKAWSAAAAEGLFDGRSAEEAAAFREYDDPDLFGSGIDLLFGGGVYDHAKAEAQGLTVAPWPPGEAPEGLLRTGAGVELLPRRLGGEAWRSDHFFGNAVSTFGICCNLDRLRDLGIERPPSEWRDLADPRYVGQVGMADPTKSGSSAKTFEMIVQSECHRAVTEAGFTEADTLAFERLMAAAGGTPGALPEGVPRAFQEAVERGWRQGLLLVQRIGANARYFTDSAGKVPVDVSQGDAAAGLAIDFFGRYQAEISRRPGAEERMLFITPLRGSSVSADPISLLRGAPNRETALRFLAFVLSEEGQRLWNYAPGAPGGPEKFALRRLPARRDFYPSDDPRLAGAHERHRAHTVDDLGDPRINPYALAEQFTYHPRWTAAHFGFLRDYIRAQCLDAGEELRAAWAAIAAAGGPDAQPEAMRLLEALPDRPEPLTWEGALTVIRRHGRMDCLREWTIFFRGQYAAARAAVKEPASP